MCRFTRSRELVILLFTAMMVLAACQAGPAPTELAPAETSAPTAATAPTEAIAPATQLPEKESGPAVDKDTIVVASVDIPNTLDPEHDVSDQMGVASTHATLVEYKYLQTPDGWYTTDKSYDVQPMLAESWEVSADGKEYTFHLRAGAKSCAGNELSMDDVLYTFERHLAVKAMGLVNTNLWGMTDIKQITALDSRSFKITLPEPRPFVLSDLAIGHLSILDSKEVKGHATSDDPWAEKWVANHSSGYGAYCLVEMTPGQQMVLEANPGWFEGTLPNVRIVYKAVPEAANRFQLLVSGDVDIALKLDPRQLEDIRKLSNLKVIDVSPSNMWMNLYWNSNLDPFKNNVKLRQALSYAIPYDDIVNTVFYGHALPGRSPLTPFNPDYDPSAWHYNTDLNQAKQLLAEAGHPDGFSSNVYVNSDVPLNIDAAVLIANSFSQIGVSISVERVPPAAWDEGVNAKSFPMVLANGYSIVDTADFAIPLFWGDPNFILNWANYGADGYDGFDYMGSVNKALLSTDAAFRSQVWKEVQKNIIERAGAGFLAYYPYQIAMKQGLAGFHWHPDNYMRFRFLYWE